MTIWLFEPRDPLSVHKEHPSDSDPGAWATSLSFPFPSTIADGVHTRSTLDESRTFKAGRDDQDDLKRLKGIRIRGPLLVQLAHEGNDIASDGDGWLVPMPDDAQLFATDSNETHLLRRLVPLASPAGAQTDFDQRGQHLQFVGPSHSNLPSHKPLSHKLRYWYWEQFQTWLTDPDQLEQEGSSFCHKAQRLALAVDIDEENSAPVVAGFGGELRVLTWRRSKAQLPECPHAVKEAIRRNGHCRIVLLTPASFRRGYYPTWLRTTHAEQCGVKADLRAIAIHRPHVVSGWDLASGRPKPSHRLAPAGTVLFLSIKGSDAGLTGWIEKTWMQCVSDEEQDRRNGLGLAVLGVC